MKRAPESSWRGAHGQFCPCESCSLTRRRKRIHGAASNGWTSERIAEVSQLPINLVNRILDRAER